MLADDAAFIGPQLMVRARRTFLGAFVTASFPCALVVALITSDVGIHAALPAKGAQALAPTPSPSAAPPAKPAQRSAAKPAPKPGPAAAAAPAAAKKRAGRKTTRAVRRARPFVWPVRGWITSNYGWRPRGFHHGMDIACKAGTKITAAHGGRVLVRGYNWVYGRTVIVGRWGSWNSLYAHLKSTWVKKGQIVKKGDIIGTCGTTGLSTGNHLHFELRYRKAYKNPKTYLR